MAFTVFQAGSTLYGMDLRGSIKALTLPTGVTLDPSLPARFTVFGQYAVLVNSPTRPLTIDSNLNVRVLTPDPPTSAPTVGTGTGALSGNFKVRQTFRVRDAFGNLISESDFSPTSAAQSLTSQALKVTNLSLSNDAVTESGLYRTTDNTSVFFPWITLSGNTQTSIQDDLSDAGLQTFAAPALGSAPDLTLIAEFKSRLFGVSRAAIDNLRYTEVGAMYAWPSLNVQPSPRTGSDTRGITGLLRRRDALGIGRNNGIYQLTGTSTDNFRLVNVSEDAGVVSGDAVGVYKDVAFFPWLDGVYTWSDKGIDCISDDKIRRWFTRDDTFNLSQLPNSFAVIDPFRKKYKLFLASAGSTIIDCWIEYDFLTGKWWGPHTSHAFNPSSVFRFATASGLFLPMVGGTDGFLRMDRKRRVDDTITPIDMDVVSGHMDQYTQAGFVGMQTVGDPETEKFFGELTVHTKAGLSGSLTVQSTAGEVDQGRSPDDNTAADIANLTASRSRLSRVGVGKSAKVRFRNNEPNVDAVIRGFEINPVTVIGRR